MDDQERARWIKLVADFESSDLTQREFASERGVSFSSLRNWLYRLRKESRPLVAEEAKSSGQAPERAGERGDSRLLPVRVVASAAKPRRALVAVAGDDLLELDLPSGARVRFPAGTDVASSASARRRCRPWRRRSATPTATSQSASRRCSCAGRTPS